MWFRFYTEALDSPKVQRLPDSVFKGWVNILCLAKEGDGLLPSVEDIAFRLRISESDARGLVEELAKRGLLDSDGRNTTPHNWHNRQFQSDSSTERVKRFRNATETLTETAPETEADTETEQKQSRAEASSASRGKPRSARAPVLPDEEWLDQMQQNPTYSMLNVRHVYGKMLAWCEVNGKQPNRRRLINWLNTESKPMTAKSSPPKKPTGNAYVGAPVTPMAIVAAAAEDAAEYMAGYVDDLIAREDFVQIGNEYDAIVQRGGAKAEWEIRCVAYYELHKDEPATAEQVAELNGKIAELVPRSAR